MGSVMSCLLYSVAGDNEQRHQAQEGDARGEIDSIQHGEGLRFGSDAMRPISVSDPFRVARISVRKL